MAAIHTGVNLRYTGMNGVHTSVNRFHTRVNAFDSSGAEVLTDGAETLDGVWHVGVDADRVVCDGDASAIAGTGPCHHSATMTSL